MVDLSAIEKQEEESADVELSENLAEDLVEYARGNIIANEEQFLLSNFQYATGWMHEYERYVNSILIGPSAGGKTQTQKYGKRILPSKYSYFATDFSDNAAIDDEDWNKAVVAPLDEIDKISGPVREYLKSMAGEDGGYSKKRSVQDDDAESGRKTVTLDKDPVPYQMLYAPENKEGIPTELDNRLLKLFIEDNKAIREAIGRKEAGHDNISVKGLDYEYIYDTTDLQTALRAHFRELPVTEEKKSGSTSVRGASYAKLPKWVWYSAKDIFDYETTSTNRYFGMIFNLMRASAILNHHNREMVEKEVNGETVDAYLVEPQDVANVLSCQRTLLGTTHSLNPRKRTILRAVNELDGVGQGGGCTLKQIKQYLEAQDTSVPKKSTLRRILKEELEEGFYINVREKEGPHGADLFEFREEGSFSPPRVVNLTEAAADDGEDLSEFDYDYDINDPFADASDPVRDIPFKKSVEQFQDDLSTDPLETTKKQANAAAESSGMSAAEAMGSGPDTSTSSSNDQQKLSYDGVSDGEPEGDVERFVYDAVENTCGTDGRPFSTKEVDLTDYHVMGIIPEGEAKEDFDSSGTALDPEHDLWDSSMNEDEVENQLSDAWQSLVDKGVITQDDDTPDGFVAFSVVEA